MTNKPALSTSFFAAPLLIGWQLLLTAIAIVLAMSQHWFFIIAGELLLVICILQWFILEHDLGHHSFFKNNALNDGFGHIASLFSLLPFYSWKSVHHSHHVWTGWKDLDPTQPQKKLSDLPAGLIRFINICWKLWIPIFSLSFSTFTFWNLKRLRKLYPHQKKMRQHFFSVFFIVTVFGILIFFCGHFMLTRWLPAFVLYMCIADPLLLSQHTHLDYSESGGNPVRPIKYSLQPAYTRSVVYPKWVSKYVLYHFDKHGLHHQYPGVPLYEISKLTPPEENTITWLRWLKIAKRMPAHVLIFQSHKETGISL